MLNIDKVEFNYYNSPVKYSFSFELHKSDILGVVGGSGSGKSTLLSIIAGFIHISEGRVQIMGKDNTYLPPAQRPITTLFQEDNLFSHLNVFDNVAIGVSPSLKVTTQQKSLIIESLYKVSLSNHETRYPHQLSGGQKQRVAIARSLVRKEPLLLLDEPFSFLDPPLRAEMLGLVKELQQENEQTIIMVSHDFHDCLKICNKLCFIDAGCIVNFDRTADFIKNSKNFPVIQRYLSSLSICN